MIQVKISERSLPENVTELTADRINLSEYGSTDVSLNLSDSEISSMVQQGNDLVIYLANGEMIILADFYLENEDGKENRLLLIDQSGDSLDSLLPENYEYNDDGIFAQRVVVDELATEAQTAAELGVAVPSLTTIGLIAGIAGLVTIVTSADDNGPVQTEETTSTDDTTAAPTAQLAALVVGPTDGSTLSGTGEPGAIVSIDTNGDGQADETAIVNENGDWSVTLDTPLEDGAQVSATQTDGAGTVSPTTMSQPVDTSIDTTPPAAPTVNPTNGTVVSGTGEQNATIEITQVGSDAQPIITMVDENGNFSIPADPPIPGGTQFLVTQTDEAGNTTQVPVMVEVSADPTVNPSNGITISGTGQPGATIGIDTNCDHIPDFTVTVNEDGTWFFTFPAPLVDQTEVMIFQTDTAGVTSVATPVVIVDISLGADPVLNPTDGTELTGTGEPGATIEIDTNGDGAADETTVVDEDGNFSITLDEPLEDGTEVSVTQVNPDGSTSVVEASETVDNAEPAAPILDPTDGTTISGTGEPGATIEIDTNGDGVADETTMVDENGNFSVTLDAPLDNEVEISVTQIDEAGNTSEAPAVEMATINPTDGTTITGTGEPGATITIDTDGDGMADETAIVDENGEFSVTPDTPLNPNAEISVTQIDESGNASETTDPVAVDENVDSTPPTAPTVDATDGSTITGTDCNG